MDRIPKPMTDISSTLPQASGDKDVSGGLMFDIDDLLEKGGVILAREIRNLAIASTRGKLEAAKSRDLVAYIKLLSELKKEQEALAASMTDEQLSKLK